MHYNTDKNLERYDAEKQRGAVASTYALVSILTLNDWRIVPRLSSWLQRWLWSVLPASVSTVTLEEKETGGPWMT